MSNNTAPMRDKCISVLEQLQNDPAITCDIVTPTMYMDEMTLIDHTNAYVDYVRRFHSGATV